MWSGLIITRDNRTGDICDGCGSGDGSICDDGDGICGGSGGVGVG